ncbi:MAG: hypothetical protein R2939_15300 [Kofleriaceae bacterium]
MRPEISARTSPAAAPGWGLAMALAGALTAACGSRTEPAPPTVAGSGAPAAVATTDARPAAVAPTLAVRPLGHARADGLAWARGPGHGAFRRAEVAAAEERWDDVVTEARAARAADPDHLAAAWLEARALGRMGRLPEALAALEIAAAGDWPAYGEASLVVPELAALRAQPMGAAWLDLAERYRAAWATAAATALIVVAGDDVVAMTADGARWLPLTRTGGVVGVLRLPGRPRLAIVTGPALAVDVLDLGTGLGGKPVALPGARVTLRWRVGTSGEPWLEATTGDGRWSIVDATAGTRTKAPTKGAVLGPRLVVVDGRVRLSRLPILGVADVAGVAADWDEDGLASAARIGRGDRAITPPPGTFIDGDTVALSPGATAVAFAAVPPGRCPTADGVAAALVVAELATGRLHRLAPWTLGAQLDWLDERTTAIAAGGALTLQAVDGAPTVVPASMPLSLLGPSEAVACAPPPTPPAPVDAAPAPTP